MPNSFEDDLSEKNSNLKNKCTGSLCKVLKDILAGSHSNGTQPSLLIINKGTSQPLSLDGNYTPTLFTLESFDSETCLAVLSFEDLLDTSPLKTVRRSFLVNSHDIAGIAILEDEDDDDL